MGCALVLGGVGAGLECDVVSEGLELFDGSGFGFCGVVSGVVVGAGVLVEVPLTSMCQAQVSILCSSATTAVCPAADWRRDFLVPGRAGRRPAMRRKRAPK